jgi:3-hydroxybutyryl-CoA dehydrogenase
MGSGIALVAARAGFETFLYDLDGDALERARGDIRSFLARSVEKGRLTAEEGEAAVARVVATSDVDELASASLVVEAVFEDPDVKGELLRTLHDVCPATTIFASNTSTLSITELGARSGRPTHVLGMHFCLPAQLMKLVEMSPGLETDPDVFRTAWELCEQMGQRPVRTQDRPGFVLNRFVVPLNNDAIRLVERGVAEPAEIDRAVKAGLGYPLGPLELVDLVGLDTQILLAEALYGITHDPRTACPPLLRRMVAAGRLGRKTGRGFYEYSGRTMFGASG